MGFRGHAMITVLFFGVIAVFGRLFDVPWDRLLFGGMFMLLGGLFPDIDTASRGRRFFVLVLLVVLGSCLLSKLYVTSALLAAIILLSLLARHRTLFHNFYFLILLTAIFCWVVSLFFYNSWPTILINGGFFLAGCLGHLIADFGFFKVFRKSF